MAKFTRAELNNSPEAAAIRAQVKTKFSGKTGTHPRAHALTIASATHLRNQGHITPEHHAKIHAHAKKRLASHKFGSLSTTSGHYQSTPTPQGPGEEEV